MALFCCDSRLLPYFFCRFAGQNVMSRAISRLTFGLECDTMTKAEKADLKRRKWLSPIPVQHIVKKESAVSEDKVADEVKDETKQEKKVELFPKKGSTRGKNPREIEYMAFDTSKPHTLPESPEEFNAVTNTKDMKVFMEYLIGGYNDAMYSAASDEIGEFINDAWDKDTQNQFRLAVRNYSKTAETTIEEAVQLIKPGVDKGWAKKVARAEEAAKAAALQPA